MKWTAVAYEVAWIITAIIIYGICLIPCGYWVDWSRGMALPARCFVFAATPFVFALCLILLAGLVKQLFVPKMKEGKYPYPNSRQAFIWAANRWIADLVMVPLSRIVFLNDILRWMTLRLLGARVHYTAAISTPNITDFDLIRIGKNITIGAWTKLYPHLQPGNGKIILSPIEIGDGSFVGADCRLMAGTRIGMNVLTSFGSTFMLYCNIGNNARIGWHCVIGSHTRIGPGAVIGNYSKIGNHVTIDPGVVVKKHSVIPDRAHVTNNGSEI